MCDERDHNKDSRQFKDLGKVTLMRVNIYNKKSYKLTVTNKKWAPDNNRQFTGEQIQVAKKHMKRYSNSEYPQKCTLNQ